LCLGGRIYGPSKAVQDTSTPDKIVGQAYSFLERNLVTGTHKEYGYQYSFSMPSSYKYGPSQWLWGTSFSQFHNCLTLLTMARLWSTSDIMGETGCQSGNRRFKRNAQFST